MWSIPHDLERTIRSWRRSPGSTAASLLALAIGIGSTTTIFSVLSSLLLSPLPVADASRLVRVTGRDRAAQPIQISMPVALDVKKRLQSTTEFAIYRQTIRNFSSHSRPLVAHVLEVDAALFSVLGIKVVQGRAFDIDANKPGHPCQVLLAWPFWKSQLGGQPLPGLSVRLNEKPCAVNGVLPPGVDLPLSADMWAPASFDLHALANGRRIRSWFAFAHLKPAFSLARLNAELTGIARELGRENPAEDAGLQLQAVLLRDWLSSGVKHSLFILLAAVLGVLSMACANVANLLLARASTRMHEISVRVAVGASGLAIFRQLLTESLLLALAASLVGLVLTVVSVHAMRYLPDTNIPRPESLTVDWRVLTFAVLTAVTTGFLFGTLPALRLSIMSPNGILKQTAGRITESRRQQIVRKILVAAETAIATLLLIGSLLLVRSFNEVSRINPGFQTDHLLTAYLSLPPERYGADTVDSARFAKKVVDRLQQSPGIEAATVTTNGPLQSTHSSAPVQIEGQPLPIHESDSLLVLDTDVTPSFRKTLRIPLLAGRDLEDRDNRENASAILVNATFARLFFPNQNAVGKRVAYNPTVGGNAPWQEIVGVVGDTRQDSLESSVQPELYTPLARATGMFPSVIIRTRDDPASHLRDIAVAVQEADNEIPVFSPRTMEQVQTRRLGARTFNTALLTGFACVALLLASFGVFAVIAYSVAQRTSEIGLRVACGASQRDIEFMVIRQGVFPAIAGIAAGLLLAFFLNQYLASLLYAVAPTDMLAVTSAVALLTLSAVLACLVPARRAARINPWRALRYE